MAGEENILSNFLNAMNRKRQNIAMAQDSVLNEMVTWIKDNHVVLGGWQNVTHNLVDSIDYFPSKIKKGVIIGNLHAGMEYAPYIEFMANHWVLSGAINEYRDKILSLVAERVREL